MKIRNGFVSNSSSSSFILIKKCKENENVDRFKSFLLEDSWFYETHYSLSLPLESGAKEFGRWYETFSNIEDKLNFMSIQYINLAHIKGYNDKECHRIYEVIFKTLSKFSSEYLDNKYISLKFDYNKYFYDSILDNQCYIDHQSSIVEGSNTEIFNDVDSLYNFLFSDDSKIYMGSDEENYTEEYYKGLLEKYKDDEEELKYINDSWNNM